MLKHLVSIQLLICFLSSIAFAKDPLIKQTHTGDIALDPTNLDEGIHIPLTFSTALNNKTLSVQTLSVKRDNNIKTELSKAFTPTVKATTLSIAFDCAAIPGPAKYELLVRFTSNDTLVEDMPLVIIVPAGVLKITSPLNIKMTDYFFLNVLDEQVPKLELKESGGISALENIPLISVTMSGNSSKKFGLEFEKNLVSIPAGDSEFLRYHAVGDFPLGTSQVTHLVTAPGKNNQQAVVISVENSMTSLAIILLLVLGILFGTFFRYYVGTRKNWAGLAVEADEILTDLEKWKSSEKVGDASFREKLEIISETLSTAKISAKPKGIPLSTDSLTFFKTALDNARDDLKSTQEELTQRKLAFEGAIQSFLTILESNYFLPKKINEELLSAHSKVKELSVYLKTLNITAGQGELNTLLSELAAKLNGYFRIYRDNQDRFIQAPVSLLLPDEVGASLISAQISMKNTPFAITNFEASTQSLANELDEWSANYLSWKTAVLVYINFYNVYFEHLYQDVLTLVNIEKSYPKLKSLMAGYVQSVSDPQTYTNEGQDIIFADSLGRLNALWQDVFNGLTGAQPDSAILDAIENRDYQAALNLIKRLRPKMAPFSLRALSSQRLFRKDTNTQEWFVNVSLSKNKKPTHYEIESAKLEFDPIPARRELESWTRAETIVSAVFICVAGYAIFAPDFNGSPANLIAIFFSGFSLDITAQSLQGYYNRLNS